MNADARLAELEVEMPPAPKPGGTYRPVVVVGDMAYVSGHGPLRPDQSLVAGKVGADLTEEQGREAAHLVGLGILATLQQHFGTLDRIARTVKVLGMVNAAADFQNHPAVINGFSDLMADVFGEDGIGARSAVGMGSLPGNIAVEVEAIFQITPDA